METYRLTHETSGLVKTAPKRLINPSKFVRYIELASVPGADQLQRSLRDGMSIGCDALYLDISRLPILAKDVCTRNMHNKLLHLSFCRDVRCIIQGCPFEPA